MDSANHFDVCISRPGPGEPAKILVRLDRAGFGSRKPKVLSVSDALNLAAWLVAMSTEIDRGNGATFEALLEEVRK